MTPSFGEYPKEENESHLSQILTDSAPPKYYLSAKACLGILNRAANRGKPLPEVLKKALENQANRGSNFDHQGGREVDSKGKKAGKGALVQWEKTATLSVPQTLIIP